MPRALPQPEPGPSSCRRRSSPSRGCLAAAAHAHHPRRHHRAHAAAGVRARARASARAAPTALYDAAAGGGARHAGRRRAQVAGRGRAGRVRARGASAQPEACRLSEREAAEAPPAPRMCPRCRRCRTCPRRRCRGSRSRLCGRRTRCTTPCATRTPCATPGQPGAEWWGQASGFDDEDLIEADISAPDYRVVARRDAGAGPRGQFTTSRGVVLTDNGVVIAVVPAAGRRSPDRAQRREPHALRGCRRRCR